MPSASVSTATAVKPGFFTSWRRAKRRSFMTQRLHRIDSRCTASGQPAGQDRYTGERYYNGDERHRVSRRGSVEQASDNSRERQRREYTDAETGQREFHSLSNYERKDVDLLRAERHANADFFRPLDHVVGHHAVETDGCQRCCKQAEER